ncbi:MAG: IS66 family transposase [Streptosporangiaceae bacterium]
MPDEPGLPSAEELAALPHGVLAERLAEAYRVIGQLTAQVREMTARVEDAIAENGRLATRVEALERRAGKDSSTSSRPPSSDSPFRKKPQDRSLREKGTRAPGKQPGEPGTTMRLVDDPDHRFWYPPAECRECGTGLAGAPVFAQRRHQVTDILPAPAPEVTEHVAQSKTCPCCGTVSEGELPAGVRARAGYGPEAHAQAALLTCGNYIPTGRAAELMAQLAGLRASAGWLAGVRAKAAGLVESSGFMDLVAGLLRQAEAVHADETPARAAGGLRYVHLACTAFLTHMHTGDRSAGAVDAGGVLPGYSGILVRDGYHGGYGHLTGALHAWCGAHLLRDLRDLYQFEPGKQDWAEQMACLLIEARDAARDARAEACQALDPAAVSSLTSRYRAIAESGLAVNIYRRTTAANDARRIARRFLKHEDMILRFITRPDLDIFTNNEAERTIRPVKVQQRSSGGCWRTLEGLADFAVVQSYLSTATKWGIPRIDALRGLFNGHPWMPPGLAPATG